MFTVPDGVRACAAQHNCGKLELAIHSCLLYIYGYYYWLTIDVISLYLFEEIVEI